MVVVGTFAVGMTVAVPRQPQIGETIMGTAFHMDPGGKGANMATAIARQGRSVGFVGTIGDDDFGGIAERSFAVAGVDAFGLRRVKGAQTHVGLVYLLPDGANCIAGYYGAALAVTTDDVEAARDRITNAKVLLVELGVPDTVLEKAVRVGAEAGVTVILNPAPARPISSQVLSRLDYLTPNETEARMLLGLSPDDAKFGAGELAIMLQAQGPKCVIVTCGERGCVVARAGEAETLPAFSVDAIDTVGAGDAFNGGLAAALASGKSGNAAYFRALATASLSTLGHGPLEALPDAATLENTLANWTDVKLFE